MQKYADDQIPSGNIDGLAGLLSAVLTQTESIQASDDGLDGKAHNLMAAALVVIALLATQLRTESGQWSVLAIISILILIVDICMIMYLTRSRDYISAVVDLNQYPEYYAKDDELLLAQLIEDASTANDKNKAALLEKRGYFRWAALIFFAGFAVGTVSLFVTLVV